MTGVSRAEKPANCILVTVKGKCQAPEAGGKLLSLSRIRKEAGEAVLGERGREWREIRSEWEAGLDLVASCIHYVKEGEEYHTRL